MVYMFPSIKSFIRAANIIIRAASATLSFVTSAVTTVLDFDGREDTAYRQAAETVLQAFLNMDSETFEFTHMDPDANLDVGLGSYLLILVTYAVIGGIVFFLARWKFGDPGIQEELRRCSNLPSLFRGVHNRFLGRG